MYKNTDKRYTLPMKNAEASVRMEGCQVTPPNAGAVPACGAWRGDHGGLLRRFSKPAER